MNTAHRGWASYIRHGVTTEPVNKGSPGLAGLQFFFKLSGRQVQAHQISANSKVKQKVN